MLWLNVFWVSVGLCSWWFSMFFRRILLLFLLRMCSVSLVLVFLVSWVWVKMLFWVIIGCIFRFGWCCRLRV